jgi:hypothetical protein
MVHQISSALYPSISQLTYLLTVIAVPSPTIELSVKLLDELSVYKISKTITYIARVVVVNRKVQKVDSLTMLFTDLL